MLKTFQCLRRASQLRNPAGTSGGLLHCVRRTLSTQAEVLDSDDVNTSVLPSKSFVKKNCRTVKGRERLASLVAEIQLFGEFFNTEAVKSFTDDEWSVFYNMSSPDERSSYLLSLRSSHEVDSSDVVISGNHYPGLKISEVNEQKMSNGEMVYSPQCHQLWELRGQDFRAAIDKLYGCRLLSQKRTGEPPLNFMVDCRFLPEFAFATQNSFMKQLQELHEFNWNSRVPFNLSFVNMRPDRQISDLMKKRLLFLFGPNRQETRDGENGESGESEKTNFRPHPFIPSITTRGLDEAIQKDGSDSILYVGLRSTRTLPDTPPPGLKTMVVCASADTQPWSSAVSAAAKHNLPVYRIPYEKYIKFSGGSKFFPLKVTSSILSDWTRGIGWGTAIHEAVNGKRVQKRRRLETQERERERMFRLAISDMNIMQNERRREVTDWNPIIGEKKNSEMVPRNRPEGKRSHRYSREERAIMRQKEAHISSMGVHRTTVFPPSMTSDYYVFPTSSSDLSSSISPSKEEIYYLEWTGSQWTRQQVVTAVSLAYVVISILMVFLWSAYLCLDGRRTVRTETRVIHMLVERTRAVFNLKTTHNPNIK